MKTQRNLLSTRQNLRFAQNGFTLIGALVVTLIFSTLFMWLFKPSSLPLRQRTELRNYDSVPDYRKEVKSAIVTFVRINGRLPFADIDNDGDENMDATSPPAVNFKGTLPYRTLSLPPSDPWGRIPAYEVHNGLVEALATTPDYATALQTCNTLEVLTISLSPFPKGLPHLWDGDSAPPKLNPVAVLVVSAGPGDADSDGSIYDAIYNAATLTGGDNTTGDPYLKKRPTPWPKPIFDDIIIDFLAKELLFELKAITGTPGEAPPVFDWNNCP